MKESFDHMYQTARRAFAARYGAQEASAIAFALLEDKYGVSRTNVLLGKDKDFSAEEHNEFAEIVKKISAGLPMQYAVGRALFCGRYFKVTPDTLIPRAETEGVLDLLTPQPTPPASRAGGEECPSSKSAAEAVVSAPPARGAGGAGFRVLDCGTGSGCIAITIALEHPDWEVEAWDISEGALAVAEENAAMLGAQNVTFLRRDILAEAQQPSGEQYAILVSNPPYICDKEAAEMEAHVLDHEPHTALFVPDSDPLLFYRALAEIGRARLVSGGWIVVECNRAYTQETAALFRDYGFLDVEIIDDCFGAPRFVRGRK